MTNKEYKENCYKAKFFEAVEKAKKNGVPNTAFTFEMIAALAEMARHDVWPDGRFGDADCNVWSMLRK